MSDQTTNINTTQAALAQWSWYKKLGFRIIFIFFLAMSIPFASNWYNNVFTLNWLRPHYRDIYDIARFQPSFQRYFGGARGDSGDGDSPAGNNKVQSNNTNKPDNKHKQGNNYGQQNNNGSSAKKSFLADYTDWGIALLIGIVGGLIWTLFDRKSKSYNILYYWLRVVVRYRAGIGIIGFGFTKLFPTQMPYPSLGLLNSNFGDYTAQKIYWLSVGIVPWYQVFGGIVEIAAGVMLLFRKTATFGALLLVGALGDITFVNYAYDGGVHVYAFYFVFLALFLLADDIPKLYNLLILERYTVPFHIYPDFRKPWLKYTRIGLKALTFLIFFVILTYTEVINFKYDPYKQPSTAGIKQLRGNYHVTQFKINGQDIPYNPLDSTRWQEATFENWTTLTFKDEKKMIDPHAWSTRRDREFAQKGPELKRNRMILKYGTVDGSRVILSGVNERKDSIYVVLDRYDRKYILPQSTLSAGKY
jgi:hypothetical protein